MIRERRVQEIINRRCKYYAHSGHITSVSGCLNILLGYFLRLLNCLLRLLNRLERFLSGQHGTRCTRIFYDMVIAINDQQLAAAIALLIAALKKLYIDKDISIYHFDLVVSFAFLNSTTFTCATFSYHFIVTWEEAQKRRLPLSSIKPEIDGCKRRLKQQPPWVMRIVLMLTLDGLLIYSAWVSGRNRQIPAECPVFCFLQMRSVPNPSTCDWEAIIWYMVWPGLVLSNICNYWFLAMAYNWRLPRTPIGSLIVNIRQNLRSHIPEKSLAYLAQVTEVSRAWLHHLRGTYIYHIIIVYVALLVVVWREKPVFEEDPGAEDSMGFGQIVPLLLLILLLVQLINSISGK